MMSTDRFATLEQCAWSFVCVAKKMEFLDFSAAEMVDVFMATQRIAEDQCGKESRGD